MNKQEWLDLQNEYNEKIEKGTEMYSQMEEMGTRCLKIIEMAEQAGIPFDRIGLFFGADLEFDLDGVEE